jgi:hypothetical protein
MKGTSFNKPLEWNIETKGETWHQGSFIEGKLNVKNHGAEKISILNSGVGLAYADIKKVHSRSEGIFKPEISKSFEKVELLSTETLELNFKLKLPDNCPVTDKKASYYLIYGRDFSESHLQMRVDPLPLFGKVIGLLDTFHRFKLKEYKATKQGVEYKLLPPTSREFANVDSLAVIFTLKDEQLLINYDFLVKKLDTTSATNKIVKASTKASRSLAPKEYSLGKDMINQDQLLKSIQSVLDEIKLNNIF